MDEDSSRDHEGEVTRVEAVEYLDGGVGHAVGSTLFVVAGAAVWLTGRPAHSAYVFAIAFLLAGNGLSIWAWSRLHDYFGARVSRPDSAGETRTLRARPISPRSRVTLLAGAVMVPTLAVALVLAVLVVQVLGPVLAGSVFVGILVLGNLAAIANTYFGWER